MRMYVGAAAGAAGDGRHDPRRDICCQKILQGKLGCALTHRVGRRDIQQLRG